VPWCLTGNGLASVWSRSDVQVMISVIRRSPSVRG
jgi:hypothetical protein